MGNEREDPLRPRGADTSPGGPGEERRHGLLKTVKLWHPCLIGDLLEMVWIWVVLRLCGPFFLVGLLARDVLEWDSWVWHVVCMHARDFVGIGECVHAF